MNLFNKDDLKMKRGGLVPRNIWNALVDLIWALAVVNVEGGTLRRSVDGSSIYIKKQVSGGGAVVSHPWKCSMKKGEGEDEYVVNLDVVGIVYATPMSRKEVEYAPDEDAAEGDEAEVPAREYVMSAGDVLYLSYSYADGLSVTSISKDEYVPVEHDEDGGATASNWLLCEVTADEVPVLEQVARDDLSLVDLFLVGEVVKSFILR